MEDLSVYDILAVDDVPLNLKVLSKMLEQFNFTVRTAQNGWRAMDAVLLKKPDLILLDILMPGIDGFDVLKRLKGDSSTADIPVVMVSALSNNASIVRALELGAKDYITKPVSMEKLVNCVSGILLSKK